MALLMLFVALAECDFVPPSTAGKVPLLPRPKTKHKLMFYKEMNLKHILIGRISYDFEPRR